MKIQILTLDKQFVVIDSEVPFMLVANPVVSYIQGVPQFPEDGNLRGTDYCNRRAGAWQINAWKLLSKQDFPLRPVFTLALVYDDTDNPLVDVRYSDLNLGEGLAGINGQLVDIDPSTFNPIVLPLQNIESLISSVTSPIVSSVVPSVFIHGNFFSLDSLDVGDSVTILGDGGLSLSFPFSSRLYVVEALGFSVLAPTGSTSYQGFSRGDIFALIFQPSSVFFSGFCSISPSAESITFDVSKKSLYSFNVSSSDFNSNFLNCTPSFFRVFRVS